MTVDADEGLVGDSDEPAPRSDVEVRHTPVFTLEQGLWQVKCRVCGWWATDPARRRLASRFRYHLQGEPQGPTPGV